MNFQLAPTGHSFRGSMAYYLHDKRGEEGGAHPTTSERVAWTETRNLPTDGPHTATRVMIATASQAEELKAAAGIKATGRKATAGPVFAFSLQWRADELEGVVDRRAEMTRAADHALRTLGLDDRQAVLVAHTDRAHPHVHVIVSRVSPEDGRMAKIDPNKVRALDKWAGDYERGRGKVVSPNRAEKFERIEEKRREHPDPEKRRAYVLARDQRRKAADARRLAEAKHRDARTAPEPRRAEPTPAAILKALGDDQRARHKAAWSALAAQDRTTRAAIYKDSGARIAEAAAQHKELARPLWAQHFRQARDEAARFAARERETLGILSNALTAAKQQMARGEEPGRGMLSLTFANVLSADRRARAFTAQQETRRGELAKQLRGALDSEVGAIKAARGDALAKQRETASQARADLIGRQDGERAKIREAWRQLYAREGREPYPRAGRNARLIMEPQPMRDDFDKAKRLAQANPTPQPTERRHVSQPAPAPSPAGTPPQPKRMVQDVPKRPEPTMPEVKRTPTPAKDWTRAAPPPPANPAPARDWTVKPEPSREIKPLPPRSQDRDRER